MAFLEKSSSFHLFFHHLNLHLNIQTNFSHHEFVTQVKSTKLEDMFVLLWEHGNTYIYRAHKHTYTFCPLKNRICKIFGYTSIRNVNTFSWEMSKWWLCKQLRKKFFIPTFFFVHLMCFMPWAFLREEITLKIKNKNEQHVSFTNE